MAQFIINNSTLILAASVLIITTSITAIVIEFIVPLIQYLRGR